MICGIHIVILFHMYSDMLIVITGNTEKLKQLENKEPQQ